MRYRVPVVAKLLVAPCLALACAVSAARADTTRADGATLAGACEACHGPNGQSEGAVPSLAGLDQPTFIKRMQSFRGGAGTIMNRIAPAYDDAETRALADYFAAADSAADEHAHAP